jgi:hypothetical protein
MQAGTAGGTVQFTEAAKVSGSANTFRLPRPVINRMSMAINIHAAHNNVLADGAMVVWDRDFTNELDHEDAIKMQNSGENFGIINNKKVLMLESRKKVVSNDTIQLYIKNLRRQSYQMKFNPKHFDNEINTVTLYDRFTNQSYVIRHTDTSNYQFVVNATSGSFDSTRFYIVLNAKRRVQPQVLNPVSGISDTEKKNTEVIVSDKNVTVYPNPILGKTISLSIQNMELGEYQLEIQNILGTTLKKQQIQIVNRKEQQSITLPSQTPSGVYTLSLSNGISIEKIRFVVL